MAISEQPIPTTLDLPHALHQATRAEHASLNRAIVARLPLCLSPSASSPIAYASGMTVFSHIYIALEEAWEILLDGSSGYKLDERQREILVSLKTNHLSRVQRLRSDLENLKRRLGSDSANSLNASHTQTIHFQQEIRNSLQAKPHVLLAYTWTMYLALFNGGRWIVNQLLSSDPEYWFGEQDKNIIADTYLSFWFFDDSPRDHAHGETVKIEFKRNFNAVAALLTEQEQRDVIEEAKKVFAMCADMVQCLDSRAASGFEDRMSNENATVLGYLRSLPPLAGLWHSLKSVAGYMDVISTKPVSHEVR